MVFGRLGRLRRGTAIGIAGGTAIGIAIRRLVAPDCTPAGFGALLGSQLQGMDVALMFLPVVNAVSVRGFVQEPDLTQRLDQLPRLTVPAHARLYFLLCVAVERTVLRVELTAVSPKADRNYLRAATQQTNQSPCLAMTEEIQVDVKVGHYVGPPLKRKPFPSLNSHLCSHWSKPGPS